MKVKIKYNEIQYFELEKEIEMSAKDYKRFQTDVNFRKELEGNCVSECGDECHIVTEALGIEIEKA